MSAGSEHIVERVTQVRCEVTEALVCPVQFVVIKTRMLSYTSYVGVSHLDYGSECLS